MVSSETKRNFLLQVRSNHYFNHQVTHELVDKVETPSILEQENNFNPFTSQPCIHQ